MGSIRIPLNSRKYPNLFAIIDEEDYELVGQHSWRPQVRSHTFYARSNVDGSFMHRLILTPPDGFIVDHINHDGLDNRRENIRLCTPKQNAHNMRPYPGSSSRFKNVSRDGRRTRWTATGMEGGSAVRLGAFVCEELAARVSDRYHRNAHGEFAFMNFPDSPIPDDLLNEWIDLDRRMSEALHSLHLQGNQNGKGARHERKAS